MCFSDCTFRGGFSNNFHNRTGRDPMENFFWRKGFGEMDSGLHGIEKDLDCIYAGFRDMQISQFICDFDHDVKHRRCHDLNCDGHMQQDWDGMMNGFNGGRNGGCNGNCRGNNSNNHGCRF